VPDEAERWGLVPDALVKESFPGEDPVLDRAVAGAARGDWKPAADVLASTWGSWDRRAHVTQVLTGEGARDEEWLAKWRADRPDDRDLAVVDAASWARVAREIRGDSDDEQHVARRATELAQDDPTPWWTLLQVARGLSFDQAAFAELWHGVVTRAPRHRAAHEEALGYWAEQSHEVMFDLAVRSGPALVLHAAFLVEDADPHVWRSGYVTTALEELLSGDLSNDDRGYVVLALYDRGRFNEVVEHFRVLGERADGAPWHRYDDPKGTFLEYRRGACRQAKR
jgi:hypothetical protein